MGNYLSSEFYLYTRKKATDQYELQVEFSEGNPMSRFKHEVYAYALNKNYKDDKSLYLYCGYQRVAKAHICGSDVKFLEVSFVSEEVSEEWDSCQEQMPNIYVDICWCSLHRMDQPSTPIKRRVSGYHSGCCWCY